MCPASCQLWLNFICLEFASSIFLYVKLPSLHCTVNCMFRHICAIDKQALKNSVCVHERPPLPNVREFICFRLFATSLGLCMGFCFLQGHTTKLKSKKLNFSEIIFYDFIIQINIFSNFSCMFLNPTNLNSNCFNFLVSPGTR